MKPPRPSIPVVDILAWLQANHPELHATATIDRNWVWLRADLRGDHNKATREAIKTYGFVFARQDHTLPDGSVARWAHHGEKPIPFRKKKGKDGAWKCASSSSSDIDPLAAAIDAALAEVAA